MFLIKDHHEGVRTKLFVCGMPNYMIGAFVREIMKWEAHSGVEWTAKRLKSLKVDLIRMRAQPGATPSTWIARNRKGELRGVIGSLFRWALRRDQNFKRAVQCLMIYSVYVYDGPAGTLLASQRKKFLDAVLNGKPDGLSETWHSQFQASVHQFMQPRSVIGLPRPLVTYRGSDAKRAPRLFGQSSVPQSGSSLEDLDVFLTPNGIALYGKYRRIFSYLLEGLSVRNRLDSMVDPKQGQYYSYLAFNRAENVAGNIAFIQEAGLKLRSVASPLRLYQEALRPLGQLLYDVVQHACPWDCTFEQSRGFETIQAHLAQGRCAYSVDLSSATDMFPLSMQMDVLRTIIRKEDQDYVDLFEDISRSLWKCPLGMDITWKRGQPLGLFPSFGLFTLTHGLLLRFLNGNRHDGKFFVLGDDVVILDEDLYVAYINSLDTMGCPWSEDKTISSNQVCEFGGKLLTREWVIPQLKWRKPSNDNFLDLCRLLGSRSRRILTPEQRWVFDRVKDLLPPPWGPGLGFSAGPGDNFDKAWSRTQQFMTQESDNLQSVMDLRGVINHNLYEVRKKDVMWSVDQQSIDRLTRTFDEKVLLALSQTFVASSPLPWVARVPRQGLASLPPALGLSPMLPTLGVPPTRRSTLERYMAKLCRTRTQ